MIRRLVFTRATTAPLRPRTMPGMNSRNDQPIETLRISDRDKAKLLWAVEESSTQTVDTSQRRLRVASNSNDAVLTIVGDSGGKTRFAVIARDLSRWGVSVLHGRYIYPGTRCEVDLRGMDNTWQTRVGEIRHIRHIQGMIHNVGIHFDEPIDLTDFATLSPEDETRHLQELADDMPADDGTVVKQMVNRVLVVDDFASDRKLFSYWLTCAGMEVSTVNDGASALDRIEEEEFDLLVIDSRLGKESGSELIQTLRRSQFVSPILSVSASEDGSMEEESLAAGANTFLRKPFTCEQLVETAFGLMGLDAGGDTEPIYSDFNDDKDMRPLLTAFTRGLSDQISQLHTANTRNDYETIEEITHTLKGAGSGYGFEVITNHSQAVLNALDDNAADMAVIRQGVNELIAILNRIKLR